MPTLSLTDVTIRTIKPPEKGQVMYWDQNLTGFGIRASQGGSLTYSLVYGLDRKRLSFGRVGVVSLKDARQKAKLALAEHMLHGEKETPKTLTFDQAAQTYLKVGQWKPSTAKENRRLLERHFKTLNDRPFDQITTADIMRLIDGMMDTPSEANHAFTAIKSLTRWCAARGYAPDALQALRKPVKPQSRTRVLPDPEIAAVLKFARERGNYGVLLELLLLTGQRVGQFVPTFTGELKNDRITWSASAMKGNREHSIPLTDRVNTLLYELKHFNNFSTAHTLFLRDSKIPHFTRHDLRRSMASGWQRLGIPMEVTESLLAHRSGSFSGVAGVYQRYDYFAEVAEAMKRWENHLQKLLES